MIAYADKFKLISGEVEDKMVSTERSDLLKTDGPRIGERQSSQERESIILASRESLLRDASGEAEAVRQGDTVIQRFRGLVDVWRRECAVLSSTTQKAIHPAYQQIIGMGRDALPLILRELEETPDHWFWALKAISGEDPVPPEGVGKTPEMTESWLHWGRERGYL